MDYVNNGFKYYQSKQENCIGMKNAILILISIIRQVRLHICTSSCCVQYCYITASIWEFCGRSSSQYLYFDMNWSNVNEIQHTIKIWILCALYHSLQEYMEGQNFLFFQQFKITTSVKLQLLIFRWTQKFRIIFII